jgi:hypothetical protein
VEEDEMRPSAIVAILFAGLVVPLTAQTPVTIGGVSVVTVDRPGTVTTAVRLREKPSTSAPIVEYWATTTQKEPELFMPAGVTVTVVARTVAKEKVGDWNNYWYRVEFTTAKQGKVQAWAYAESILLPDAGESGAQRLTKERLLAGRWGPEQGGFGYYLYLSADGGYRIQFGGEGGGPEIGTYALLGDRLILTHSYADTEAKEDVVVKTELRPKRSDTSLYSTESLASDDGSSTFWDLTATVPEGQHRSIRGVDAITVAGMATCTADLSIRASPSTEAERYRLQYVGKESQYLPKGRSVRLLARTPDQKTVGGQTAYWYDVLVILDWEEGLVDAAGNGTWGEGWVFGAYLSR